MQSVMHGLRVQILRASGFLGSERGGVAIQDSGCKVSCWALAVLTIQVCFSGYTDEG